MINEKFLYIIIRKEQEEFIKTRHLQTKINYILLIIILIGFAAFVIIFAANAALIKKETVESIQSEIANHITTKLSSTMKIPHSINNLNQEFFNLDGVSKISLEKIQRFFVDELKIHSAANIIAVGLKNGEYREAHRLENGDIRIGERGIHTDGFLDIWSITGSDSKNERVQRIQNYRPSERPWYRSAVKKGKSTWSDIYFYSSNNHPAISGNQPLTDASGAFLGVLTTSISLRNISTFLTSLPLSIKSKIIITDTLGFLIAASDNQPLVTPSGARINGIDARDKATCLAVKKFNETGKTGFYQFSFNKEKIDVNVLPFTGPYNLSWRIFIVSPEANFTTALDKLTYKNFIILLVLLFFGFISMHELSRRIASPIKVLSDYIATISFESIHTWGMEIPAGVKSTSMEIESLSSNFEFMMHRLQTAFQALEKSRQEYKDLMENINSIVMNIAPDGTVTYINPYGLNFYGYSKEEIVGKPVLDTVLNTGDPKHNSILEKIFKRDAEFWNGENTNITKDGRKVWILWSNKLIKDRAGKITGLFSIGQDITRRKETELKLEESLKEKNILLSEVHHRVKNNLQIIISLINLQMGDISEETTLKALQIIKTRIQSMSLVHEMLYSSTSFSAIDLTDYIKTLSNDIIQTFNTDNKHITLELTSDTIMLNINQAITLGLVINEIISNAVKHAFRERKTGTISIDLKECTSSKIAVTISDNGIGTAHSGQIKQGLGTVLINALADQLEAVLETPEGEGTTIRLTFTKK